ncbi:MAG: HPr family phosphocarrier protein [Pseudomonadales bacterium]
MKESTLDIVNKLGLHARAASKLMRLCTSFNSTIQFKKIVNGEYKQTADGKNIMALMLLAAGKGTQLYLCCEGSDEEKAMEAITQLFADRFDESE